MQSGGRDIIAPRVGNPGRCQPALFRQLSSALSTLNLIGGICRCNQVRLPISIVGVLGFLFWSRGSAPIENVSAVSFTVVFLGRLFLYAAVVVPIGGDVLGVTSQGFVTRRVTHVLHVATAVTVAILTWEAVSGRGDSIPMWNE